MITSLSNIILQANHNIRLLKKQLFSKIFFQDTLELYF